MKPAIVASTPRPAIDLAPMFPTPPIAETRCRTFPLPARGSRGVLAGAKRVVYDFVEMPLGAVVRGAHVAERERRATTMTANEMQRPFARRAEYITRCWKWFSATHPGGDTTIEAQLAIDVFGATGALRMINKPEDADLAACIRDGYAAPLYVYAPRNREQQTHATLAFSRADQPLWKKTPARPRPITNEPLPERGSTCVRVIEGTTQARLPTLGVSDFDNARVPPPPPGHGRRAHVPELRIGCVVVNELPKKSTLRAAVRSNWGALEACHADARARMPELTGSIQAKVLFDANGAEPALASVSGAGDTELHACIDRALEQIWLDPPTGDGLIEANFTFVLDATLAPAIRDEDTWREKLSSARTPAERCTARRELVEDRLAAISWIDDARIRAMFAELARYVASLPRAEADTCLVELATVLHTYTGVDTHTTSFDPRNDARVDRLETLRPLAPIAPWGAQLEWMIALAYRRDFTRADEGAAMLRELALHADIADMIDADERAISVANGCAL